MQHIIITEGIHAGTVLKVIDTPDSNPANIAHEFASLMIADGTARWFDLTAADEATRQRVAREAEAGQRTAEEFNAGYAAQCEQHKTWFEGLDVANKLTVLHAHHELQRQELTWCEGPEPLIDRCQHELLNHRFARLTVSEQHSAIEKATGRDVFGALNS